jgi:hypothetical protein
LLYWYAYALNNPLKYTDPSGELIPFFIVPSISWSKDGGIDISITAGIGFYKGLSAQSTIGYSFGSNNFYAQNGVSACGATAYYGWGSQSGNYCGVSYGLSNGSGLSSNAASLGVSYSENGGWGGNFSIFQINNQGDVSINPSLSYSYSFNNFKQVRVDERNRDNFQIILASYASSGGDGTVQGYDGSYMIPAAAYDYTIPGAIDGKFTDDWNYILNGKSGNPLSRYGQILARDITAPGNGATLISAGIDVASIIPIMRIGKLAVPFKGFTAHGVNQAITRGITSPTILNTIRMGEATLATGRYGAQIRYVYKGTTVVVGTVGRNAGKIITVW